MRSHPRAVLFTLLLAAAGPLLAVDPFYQELYRDGNLAYDRGDAAGAARTLRIACFGMLDEPKLLGGCLARLAVAQDKATDLEGFRETFVRLADVEERFQGYSQADLPAEIRAALEQKLAAHIPGATLESSPPVFRALAKRSPAQQAASPVDKSADKPGSKPAAKPAAKPQTPAQPPAAAPPAKPPAAQPATPGTKPAVPGTAPPPGASTMPAGRPLPTPSQLSPLSEDEKGKLESVRKALGETGKGKELRQTFQTAREVADAHPEAIDAQRLAGEAAYRLSLWSDAVSYLQRGGGLPDNEPELLFYLAVSLYESGNRAAATAALKRSLPNLQRSPYVDAYTRKILGQ